MYQTCYPDLINKLALIILLTKKNKKLSRKQ